MPTEPTKIKATYYEQPKPDYPSRIDVWRSFLVLLVTSILLFLVICAILILVTVVFSAPPSQS